MVLPIVLVGALALGGTGGIVGLGYLAYKKWWEKMTIAVLGGRGVGKTTFIRYLETQKIESSHEQTDLAKYPAMKVKVEGITLRIAKGYDVGGSSMHHEKWREQIQGSDVVFYLLNIHRVLNKDEAYIKNVRQDIDAIKDEIKERQSKVHVFLIASHADKLPEYQSNFSKLEMRVNANQLVSTAIISFGGDDYCKVVVGSLKDDSEAKSLIGKILKRIN